MTSLAGKADDSSIPTPTLTEAQLAAAEMVAAEKGAWVRSFVDGSAEAFSPDRGGLRRFTIDQEGVEHYAGAIPANARFRCAFVGVALAVVAAVAGVVYAELLNANRKPIGLWWVWPAALLITASLIAAAYLGVHSRLPSPSAAAGPWVRVRSNREGDWSGAVRDLMLKGWLVSVPLLAVFTLAGVSAAGAVLSGALEVLVGVVFGVYMWWFMLLCFSRGWIGWG
jgi:hypothetical protein